MDEVASAFFSGDIEAAMASLAGFEVDQGELQSVGLELDRQERLAVSTDTEVSRLASGNQQDTPVDLESNTTQADRLQERLELLSDKLSEYFSRLGEPFQSFTDPENILGLLGTLINFRQETSPESPEQED